MSRNELRKKMGEDSGNAKLFNDIEAISKALYPDRMQARSSIPTISSRSKSVEKPQPFESKSKTRDSSEDPFLKEKKSIWGWKALKSFTHVRNKRFNCCFSLHVHTIEGLPEDFNGLRLQVHWKRRDGELITAPAKVFQGVATFEEELTNTCSIYGSRSGPHHSAKYEAKHFLLYASVFGAPEHDLGKHRVDLTRLLPLTLEELEEEKGSGKWTTSYRLSGKARGASMNVSFGYSVVGNTPSGSSRQRGMVKHVKEFHKIDAQSSMKQIGNIPIRSRSLSLSIEDIKDLHEVLPISRSELSDSVNVLYQKLDEEKLIISVDNKLKVDDVLLLEPLKPYVDSPDAGKGNVGSEIFVLEDRSERMEELEEGSLKATSKTCEEGTLKACEEGTLGACEENSLQACDVPEEMPLPEEPKLHSMVKVPEGKQEELVVDECNTKEENVGEKESLMKELESALKNVSDWGQEGSDSQEESEILNEENCLEVKLDNVGGRGENLLCNKELIMEEFETALNSLSGFNEERSDQPGEQSGIVNQEKHTNVEMELKLAMKGKSLSLDYATEAVACDFLDMLGIEHSPVGLSSESEPESPRERLLRQFEKDALAEGMSLFNFNIDDIELELGSEPPNGSGLDPVSDELAFSSLAQASEDVLQFNNQETSSKPRASVLEDLETEALMREWGLNEKAFQRSPSNSSGGFGSPIHLPPEDPLPLPPLGEGLGPFVQTSDGGFLRSMNPEIFRNAKSGGSLIMQVSSPVVVPAEMGSGIMDILQCLASVGIEKLSMQANKLMPLEDITGKTMQQIAWEAAPTLEDCERQVLQQESDIGQSASYGQMKAQVKPRVRRSSNYESGSIANEMDSEFVSLDDLAPLAMDKIEALSIEGLRIQSGMSDEDAPSNISPQSIGDISALEGKRVNFGGSLGLEGSGGLQLLDIKDSSDEMDGILGLSVTLDEWMRLDSGELDDEDGISERTSRILAAHHASDMVRARRKGKGSRKGGLLGNNFTVALMVQLRDPLRNFEPVGAPMLSLIQVERVFVPPKPKIYGTVSELWKYTEDEDEPKKEEEEEKKEEVKVHEEESLSIPQFKITEVHVAGLKTEPNKKKPWGANPQQQQSGSRWLLANGMGKKNSKHPLMKSKAATNKSSNQPGDKLWSISSRANGMGKDHSKIEQHTRNPNVIVPNETVKLLSGAGFL